MTISTTATRRLTEGNPWIPALVIAITKGEEAASPDFKLRDGSFEGTRRPMMVVPPI